MALLKILFKNNFLQLASLALIHLSAAKSMNENGEAAASKDDGITLWDFTATPAPDLNEWVEQSDVVREPGKSKAALVLQKSRLFQRAVFFTMLNPQPNGAGFAGVRTTAKTFNLEGYNAVELKVRAQGQNFHYKVTLHHMGMNYEPNPTYEQTFRLPSNEFTVVNLPLDSFDPYFRGKKMNASEVGPLNKSQITSFGLQVFGGVYLPEKQQGTSSLEIDWIKAV